MKKQIFTISMDKKLAEAIKALVNSSDRFRNNSHLVEQAIKRFLENVK